MSSELVQASPPRHSDNLIWPSQSGPIVFGVSLLSRLPVDEADALESEISKLKSPSSRWLLFLFL